LVLFVLLAHVHATEGVIQRRSSSSSRLNRSLSALQMIQSASASTTVSAPTAARP
jgi:hypothetical protein